MGINSKDDEIIKLLTKLKNANEGYPLDMMETRRQGYLKHMAEMGLKVGRGADIQQTVRNGTAASVPLATSRLLEAALVVAIVAEASVVAYLYRDKLADVFQSVSTTPQVQEVTAAPEIISVVPSLESTGVPTWTATPTITSTLSLVSSNTSSGAVDNGNNSAVTVEENNTTGNQVNSTPDPRRNNNGNHFGQTPKPELTRSRINNSNSGPTRVPKNNHRP